MRFNLVFYDRMGLIVFYWILLSSGHLTDFIVSLKILFVIYVGIFSRLMANIGRGIRRLMVVGEC